jgi:hypothetical protein
MWNFRCDKYLPEKPQLIAHASQYDYCSSMASRFRARDEFISGLTMTLAFGAVWIIFGSRFWIFPMIFAGIIPCVRGAIRFFTERSLPDKTRKQLQETSAGSIEREILSIAKRENGKVTPAIVALNSDISLDEAERALENMAKRGYATMDVSDSGTVEYLFPEFLD